MENSINLSWRKCPDVLWDDKSITPTAERMYVALLDLCTSASNTVKISINATARRIRCCRKSVINAMKCLLEKGLIQKAEKAYVTETNTYIVKMLLPPKKGKAIPEEQPASAKPEATEVKQAKPSKKKYGEHGRVRLTDEEYSSLITDFGQETVAKYIQIVDDYSKEHNRWYSNNAETIRKWIEEDKSKPGKGSSGGYKAGKAKYNFHGKSYRDLIEELPEERRAYYYDKIFPRQLDEVARNHTLDELVDLNKYEELVNQFTDVYVQEDADPEPDTVSETIPEPQPPSDYEMTDEEIAEILDKGVSELIYGNPAHPLFNLMPGELITLAEKWRLYKDST